MPNLAPEFHDSWLEHHDTPTAPEAADPTPVEEDVEALTGRFVQEMAAAWTMAAVHLGDRLGLYRALAAEPATAGELAARTGCHPRLVQEWLAGQVAAGFILLDDARATDHRYALSPAQALVLADGNSPVFLTPAAGVLSAMHNNIDRTIAAFRGDGAVPFAEQHHRLFPEMERFFRTSYQALLVDTWIPALDGVNDALSNGGRILDVGCGHGFATTLLAQAYPTATVDGIDLHRESLTAAREQSDNAGVGGRVDFRLISATDYRSGPYDLICFFDALHDMGDPERVIANAKANLAPGGTVMVVEPSAAERLSDAVGDPVSRLYYAGSSMICTPSALSQGHTALGNQVSDETWRALFRGAGFRYFERAAETPFNRVFQARL